MLDIIFELGQITTALGALGYGAFACIKACASHHDAQESESFRQAFGYTPGPQN
ncbi:MAG: hypothetical protein ACK4N4_06475 [Burkholderiales bacterium]